MSTRKAPATEPPSPYCLQTSDVIIPCLNEEKTISNIVNTFASHPKVRHVIVGIDGATTDMTPYHAYGMGGIISWNAAVRGKGQVIKRAIETATLSPKIILCDGDYTSFPPEAIDLVMQEPCFGHMQVVTPRPPSPEEWAKSGIPGIPYDDYAWQRMSGLRRLPLEAIRGLDLHGYLTETQIEHEAMLRGYSVILAPCEGLVAPLRFTERRLAAMQADYQWGVDHNAFR